MNIINKNYLYAIVGASNDPEKYGHKVLMDLHSGGYNVAPVNPKGGETAGLKVYPDLAAIPALPDVAVFIVPPAVTEKVLLEVKNLRIKMVWLQPGSESPAAIKFCQEEGIECVYNQCIMVQRQLA